ncbi:adenine phosphoribosyltransferase [Kalymmatonema gypsitolerans NIES-4073]|nr:adenine phosphoribosyltransferase [Scytonema sp. NIES-4073]
MLLKDARLNVKLAEIVDGKMVGVVSTKVGIGELNLQVLETKHLRESIQNAPLVDCGKYKFAKYSFGEEGTYIVPELMREIKQGLLHLYKDLEVEADYIVSTEPGAHLWGLLLAEKLGKPLNIIRTQNPRIPQNEKLYEQRTGYCVRNLQFENFAKGDRVVIVEDVISTGATIRVIVNTLESLSVEVLGVISIFRKGTDTLDTEYNVPNKSIL